MSKRNKKFSYVLLSVWYDYRAKKYVWYKDYYTRKQLISKIAVREVYRNHYDSIINNLTDDINTIEYGKYFIGKVRNNEIINVPIESLINNINEEITKKLSKLERKDKKYTYRKKAESFKFRDGAVPNIHKSHWHRGSYYRHPKLKSIKKSVYSSEYKEFTKGKDRQASLLVWDDRIRHTDKCWKTSYKVRKQWQKHLPKHKDNILYTKRQYDLD